jgi:hypothetical protein
MLLSSYADDNVAESTLAMIWYYCRVMLALTLPEFLSRKKGGQSLLSPGITKPESDISADSEHATSFLGELARLSRP